GRARHRRAGQLAAQVGQRRDAAGRAQAGGELVETQAVARGVRTGDVAGDVPGVHVPEGSLRDAGLDVAADRAVEDAGQARVELGNLFQGNRGQGQPGGEVALRKVLVLCLAGEGPGGPARIRDAAAQVVQPQDAVLVGHPRRHVGEGEV